MLASLPKTIAATLLVLTVLLAIVEVACRVLIKAEAARTKTGYVVPDRELLWRLAPQADGEFATNELGLRDTPFNAAADHRVLLLGDSVAWGDSMPVTDFLFPAQLERSLSAALAPRSIEVINAAVPGYSTFQELGYYRLHGRQLAPQVVVLEFCLNDVVERFTTVAQYGGDGVFLGVDTRPAVAGIHGALLRNSRAYEHFLRTLQRSARWRQDYAVTELVRAKPSTTLEQAWADTLASLDDLARDVRRDGSVFLLVIFPYRFQLADPVAARRPQDRLIAFARAHDLEWLDLLDGFVEAHAKDDHRLFIDENHLALAGHLLAAKLMTPRVLALLESDH